MRLQLALAVVALALGAPAHADGLFAMRGVYYKERATRVIQPMLDAQFDVGTRGLVTSHFLVDAITSASSSSGAENATPFTENRYEGGLSYIHDLDQYRVGAEAKYSTESDYVSAYGGVRGEVDLAQKNTTLGAGLGIIRDEISAASSQGLAMPTIACSLSPTEQDETKCSLASTLFYATASQILDKNAIIAFTYDIAKLDGYQSNPYRRAIADDGMAPERHPTERLRQAVAVQSRYYVPRTQTTLIAAYRFYRDNWKINAHTPEVRIIQQVGRTADASLRYRLHSQNAAFFYRDRYPTTDDTVIKYISDDVKLDAFRSHLVEAKLGILGETFGMTGRWAGARFEGILQYAILHDRFGNAIIAHVALSVPFEY